jgi:hypothetical protein
LRLICDAETDYTKPIEPSVAGGTKIATAIARVVREHRFKCERTAVFIERNA